MKLKTIALVTAIGLGNGLQAKPAAKEKAGEKPTIEVCFVLDTTGSMSGLIQGAKEKIWSIANEIVDADPTPDLRIGLIGYRDRGDQYITRSFELTDDIDMIYDRLLKFEAGGGGDGPESVNQALHEAVTTMDWSESRDVLKIIFLVGDAPPHMDYDNDVQYPEVCQMAMKRDLIINTIQCGTNRSTTPIWKEIASKSEGDYAAILQDGGTIAISTPLDDKISELNRELNGTVVGYGDRTILDAVETKVRNNMAAAPEAVAARVSYLSKKKEAGAMAAKQVSGDQDLIALIAEKKIDRSEIKVELLPKEVADMKPEERNRWIDQKIAERSRLQDELSELLTEREELVEAEKEKLAREGKGDGFDEKVQSSLRRQAMRKGILYR